MNVKDSNTEKYPEHLNPFNSRSGGISKSIRGFFRATVRSFSRKDKERPVIRPKPDTSKFYVEQKTQERQVETPIPLPRSRFSERISKTEILRETSNRRQSSPAQIGKNPFEDEEPKKTEYNHVSPPKPTQRTKHFKRIKKRAPTPPDSALDGYLSSSVNGSKWSLASTDSDMSSVYRSESEAELKFQERQIVTPQDEDVRTEEILNLTREIAQFTEDTNNNTPQIEKNTNKADEVEENSQNKELNPENAENKALHLKDIDLSTQIETPEVEKINNSDVIKSDNESPWDLNQNPLKEEDDMEFTKSVQDEVEGIVKRLNDPDYITETRNSDKQEMESYFRRNSKVRKTILTKEKLLGSQLD